MASESFQTKANRFFHEANGGNPITIQQLRDIILRVIPNYDFGEKDEKLIEMFHSVDLDNDKDIEYDEYCRGLFKKSPADVTREELQILFTQCDKDGSGKLNKDELMGLAGKQLKQETLERIVKECDKSGDGLIDTTEFMTFINKEFKN